MPDSFHHFPTPSTDRPALPSKHDRPRRFLAVGMEGPTHGQLKAYALQLGARIGCEVVLLTLVQSSLPQTGAAPAILPARCVWIGARPEDPWHPAGTAENRFEFKAHARDLSLAVGELTRELKRIEFILTDANTIKDNLSETELTPVFRIMAAISQPGGKNMSSTPMANSAKPIGKTILLGAISAALYAAVFWKADFVMKLFTRGGLYAALPIATVFAVSFAHGAFASNLWSLLGIQARPTTEAYKSVAANVQPAKVKTKRPRAQAYVNPFHNIDLKSK
jgi:hypothetical protein